MLGLDEQAQIRWRQQESKETQIEARQRNLAKEELSNAATVAPDNGFDVTDSLAQMGRPMTAQQVIGKLRLCNRHLVFLKSKNFPDKYGIYLHNPVDGKVYVDTDGTVYTITFICGMEAGMMPEFSLVHKTKKKVANQELFGKAKPTREVDWKVIDTFADETRGWRTILARLLRAGLINQADVDKHFGWMPSRASQKWHDQTT